MKKLTVFLLVFVLLAFPLFGCSSESNDTVSDSLREEIQNAYLEQMLSAWELQEYEFASEDADTVAGMQYYGTYNGYTILMDAGNAAVISTEVIGGKTFMWGSGSLCLYAYKDGEFHDLKDIYDAGHISVDEIGEIAVKHKAYFSQSHGWDYDIAQKPELTVTDSKSNISLTFSYEVEKTTYSPGDVIEIRLCVRNTGKPFDYTGAPEDLLGSPVFTLNADGEPYTIQTEFDISTDDATPRVFETGESTAASFSLTIPEDAQEGSYDMYFFVKAVKAEFADVLMVKN